MNHKPERSFSCSIILHCMSIVGEPRGQPYKGYWAALTDAAVIHLCMLVAKLNRAARLEQALAAIYACKQGDIDMQTATPTCRGPCHRVQPCYCHAAKLNALIASST